MRTPFNDDNTNKGVEGWYDLIQGKLVIFIKSTNSREDWKANFIAFRVYNTLAKCRVHTGLNGYAHWMYSFIKETAKAEGIPPDNVIIIGYSMGGGIAQILGEINHNHQIYSIDGPRTTTKLTNKKSILYFNRGSLVSSIPFWFKRIENRICLNKKWRPFWKSHLDYDIDNIIQEVV